MKSNTSKNTRAGALAHRRPRQKLTYDALIGSIDGAQFQTAGFYAGRNAKEVI